LHPHRPALALVALIFTAVSYTDAGSTQMKATAPEKMMPSGKAQKMRDCEKRADEQKIKMEDRARFVNECIATGAK